MAALRTDETMMKGQHAWELERLHFMQKPPDTWHPYSSGKVVGGRTLTLYHAPTPDPPPFSPNKTVGSSPVLACAFTVCNVCVQECFVCHSVCHCHPGVHMTTAPSHSPDWLTDWLKQSGTGALSHIALPFKLKAQSDKAGDSLVTGREHTHTHTHLHFSLICLIKLVCYFKTQTHELMFLSLKGHSPDFTRTSQLTCPQGQRLESCIMSWVTLKAESQISLL